MEYWKKIFKMLNLRKYNVRGKKENLKTMSTVSLTHNVIWIILIENFQNWQIKQTKQCVIVAAKNIMQLAFKMMQQAFKNTFKK